MGILITGAHYHTGSEVVTMAPFGSGCGQLLPLFSDLQKPQSMISATDVARRHHLPPEFIGFTVTPALYERLCLPDGESFLEIPFYKRLKDHRAKNS